MKRITQTKEIQSGDNSGIVVSGNEKISYIINFVASDFTDNELITLRAVNELIASYTPSPIEIDFDWNVNPVTSFAVPLGYGNNPRIEVWLILSATTEMNYTGSGYAGRMIKEYTGDVLTQVSFPDMLLDEFSPSKTGYFLIAK